MIQMCSITQLRARLGQYVDHMTYSGTRIVILKNGRELAGLVPVRDLNLLDQAATRSLDYRAYQIAEEMLRWRIIKEGMERAQKGK